MHWDANNLYGWVMIQDLPHSSFKFLSKEEVKNFNLDSVAENSQIEYILEVDLEYCKELHDLHNDYPLCPEKIKVSYDMLSGYCKDIADWYGIKVGEVKKLIPNLGDKIEYVAYYKNLQYYLSLGMKLVKIHGIFNFRQSNWLKRYSDFNTEKRQKSPDEFNKNLYKLLNNCIYGKSIESQRKRMNVKLVNDKKVYQRCVNKQKTALTLSKPIYVGFSILELSKLLMYQFHYDYVLKTSNDVKLLFTDTDSFVYEIRGGNVYDQCFKDRHLFDFSGYSKDSIYCESSNKIVLGKMKDELAGIEIKEFVGLIPKCFH